MRYVLSLFDYTGNMVRPWAAAGYTCYCLDIQHECVRHESVGTGVIYYLPADVRTYRLPKLDWAAAFSFSPCTDVAVSGARWFMDKGPRRLVDAMDLFVSGQELCLETGAPGFCENPVSVLSTHLRKPDYSFDPCDYAGYADAPELEAYTKKTCLWAHNGFIMPPARRVAPALGSKMWKLPPGPERANLRSETPKGFARAVYEHLTAAPDFFSAPAAADATT